MNEAGQKQLMSVSHSHRLCEHILQAKAASDEIQRRWIAVAEQLPGEGVMVLGWDKADGIVLTINVGVSNSGHRIWFGCSPNAGEYEDAKRYSDPTHWMPLPASPSDDE